MLDEERTRRSLLSGLEAYDGALADPHTSERAIDQLLSGIAALVPHAEFFGLFFWGERERSRDEIVDEAIARERLWLQEGELALLIYKEAQMRDALNDANRPPWAEQCIESELPLLIEKIASFSGSKSH